jgi:three-Cys-motif partner protein
MAKDLHKKPFDEGTKVKLALYANYMKEWLPVFLTTPARYESINIFDFFAGPGMDNSGFKGSPLILIDLLSPYWDNIISNTQKVTLYFNDKSRSKIRELEKNVSALNLSEKPYDIEYSNKEFDDAFNKYLQLMNESNTANFLFLDQSGIKHITDQVFKTIVDLPVTDFLFFTSSSTLHRFMDHPEIKKYISLEEVSPLSYYHVHRMVLEYYRSLIPVRKEYYLTPFSIKKGANVYGLIFGTGHLLGIDKFNRQCWKIDPNTGDSNFDIDQDNIDPSQPSLFPDRDRPKKVQTFEMDLAAKILKRKLVTNKDIFRYTLMNGFTSEHARKVLRDLIRAAKLPKQRLPISYNSCKGGTSEKFVTYG